VKSSTSRKGNYRLNKKNGEKAPRKNFPKSRGMFGSLSSTLDSVTEEKKGIVMRNFAGGGPEMIKYTKSVKRGLKIVMKEGIDKTTPRQNKCHTLLA